MINQFFDAIYVINLPERRDRREEMEAQFGRLGLSLDAAGVILFPAVRPDCAGGFPSIGSRGCFMSHLGVLRDALAKGFGKIAIFEDDLDFSASFPHEWPAVSAMLGAQAWSIFYGGYYSPSGSFTSNEVPPEVPIQTTHFVAFQREVFLPLIEYLEAILTREPGHPEGGPMHVDGAYSWFRAADPGCKTLVAIPPLGFQRASRSDIAAPRWFDRQPILAPLVALARRAKRRLSGG